MAASLGLGGSGAGSGGQLHRFSLTFVDRDTEKEFGRTSKERLLNDLFFSGILMIVVCVGSIIFFFTIGEPPEEDVGIRFAQALIYVWLFGNSIVGTVVVKMKTQTDRMELLHLEFFTVCGILNSIACTVLAIPHYVLRRIVGAPQTPQGACDADTLLLLTLTALAIGPLMGLSCRWHMLIPVQVACILAYALPALILGSPQRRGEVIVYIIVLTGLVGCASHGRRVIQRQERQAFIHLIEEKARRFSSEFQLSQLRSGSVGAIPEEETRSVAQSAPTTTDTGKAFEIGTEAGSGLGLQRIEDIGVREQWLVQGNELSCMPDCIIGVGGFGIVMRGEYQGVPVAVKVPKTSPQALRNRSSLLELCNELHILRRLRHPNIVIFYAAWLDSHHTDIAIVLELVNGVSLRNFVCEDPSAVERAEVLAQISCALRYLHTRYPHIVHGDLKNTNIFVVSGGGGGEGEGSRAAKLLDFGLARRITKNARPLGGSLRWMAPEVLQQRSRGAASVSVAADVFSLGRVVYFVATGRIAGEDKDGSEVMRDLKRNVLPELHWPPQSQLGADCRDLVERCHQAAPAARPKVAEVHASLVQIWRRRAGLAEAPQQPPPQEEGRSPDLHRQIGKVRQTASRFKSQAAIQLARRVLPQDNQQVMTPSSTRSHDGATSGGRGEHARLVYPVCDPTPTTTDAFLLARMLHRCNFYIDTRACCEYHAALQKLRQTIDDLSAKPCRALAEDVVGQCAACGAIFTKEEIDGDESLEGHECDVCGEALNLQGLMDGSSEEQQEEENEVGV